MLPLDLHVLGLSLAFILSQDQTLRCMISFYFFYTTCWLVTETFTRLVLLFLSIVISSRIACFFHSKTDCKSKGFILILQKNPSFFHCCPSLPKSVCKSKNFHSYLQIFLALFLYTYNKYFYNCLQITLLYTKTFLNKKLCDVGC